MVLGLDELGSVTPRTFPPALGWALDGLVDDTPPSDPSRRGFHLGTSRTLPKPPAPLLDSRDQLVVGPGEGSHTLNFTLERQKVSPWS